MQNSIDILMKQNRLFKSMLLTLMLLPLGGCLGLVPTAIATSTASLIHTDRLIVDTIAEVATGMDCSYVRHLEDKGDLCRPLREPEYFVQPSFCYKEFGAITCYDRPLEGYTSIDAL